MNWIPYPPTRSQSNGLAHRVGTRDIVWQLTTLSVHLYDPCTLSSRTVEGSTAAGNLRGLSLPPFPLSITLRFSLPISPTQPAAKQGAGSRPRLTKGVKCLGRELRSLTKFNTALTLFHTSCLETAVTHVFQPEGIFLRFLKFLIEINLLKFCSK